MRLWLVATLFTLGCGGRDTDVGPPGISDRFPRLSHAQWEATVQDLFQLPAVTGLSASFQPDPPLGRFDNNIARLGVTAGLWRDYQRAAETVAETVAKDPALLAGVVATATDPRDVVTSFGLRAFRRPLQPAEIDRYVALFATAPAVYPEHDAFTAGVRQMIATMLQSPYFLYRAELSDSALGGYEMASRLSYLFWNTMPDTALFAAAQAGDLATADGVRAQALRMLDDPRAHAQFRRFYYQAYSLAQYANLSKDATLFPNWRPEIGAMMQEEAQRFLDHVLDSGGGVAEILTSTKAYVNADLAKIYGLSGTFGDDYTEVDLDPTQRAGFLTRTGFLARNATLQDPDPIHRGVFINLEFICRKITAPPAIPPVLNRTGNTNRERIDSITGEGTCGERCHHVIINPIGYAFEEYDAVGAYRTTDHGYPVDTADKYRFEHGGAIAYANALELSQKLAAAPEVHFCYATQLLEFMLGHDLAMPDVGMAGQLAFESLHDRKSIKDLVLEVVTSNAFRARRSQP